MMKNHFNEKSQNSNPMDLNIEYKKDGTILEISNCMKINNAALLNILSDLIMAKYPLLGPDWTVYVKMNKIPFFDTLEYMGTCSPIKLQESTEWLSSTPYIVEWFEIKYKSINYKLIDLYFTSTPYIVEWF